LAVDLGHIVAHGPPGTQQGVHVIDLAQGDLARLMCRMPVLHGGEFVVQEAQLQPFTLVADGPVQRQVVEREGIAGLLFPAVGAGQREQFVAEGADLRTLVCIAAMQPS